MKADEREWMMAATKVVWWVYLLVIKMVEYLAVSMAEKKAVCWAVLKV